MTGAIGLRSCGRIITEADAEAMLLSCREIAILDLKPTEAFWNHLNTHGIMRSKQIAHMKTLPADDAIEEVCNVLLQKPLNSLPVLSEYLHKHNKFLHYLLGFGPTTSPYTKVPVITDLSNLSKRKLVTPQEREEDELLLDTTPPGMRSEIPGHQEDALLDNIPSNMKSVIPDHQEEYKLLENIPPHMTSSILHQREGDELSTHTPPRMESAIKDQEKEGAFLDNTLPHTTPDTLAEQEQCGLIYSNHPHTKSVVLHRRKGDEFDNTTQHTNPTTIRHWKVNEHSDNNSVDMNPNTIDKFTKSPSTTSGVTCLTHG